MYAPKVRKLQQEIDWFLVTTSAMPSIMVPLTTKARTTFKLFTKPFGNKKTHFYNIGFKGRKSDMFFKVSDSKLVNKIVQLLR